MAIIIEGDEDSMLAFVKTLSSPDTEVIVPANLGECPECGQPLQARLREDYGTMNLFEGLEGPSELVICTAH